jgi:hypothetical protein
MTLNDAEKKKVMSRLRGHESHELKSAAWKDLLFVVHCSCGTKIEYTQQPINVAIHIKREYWDPTPGTGVLASGKPYRYAGRWMTIHHDYNCRFHWPNCVCDR